MQTQTHLHRSHLRSACLCSLLPTTGCMPTLLRVDACLSACLLTAVPAPCSPTILRKRGVKFLCRLTTSPAKGKRQGNHSDSPGTATPDENCAPSRRGNADEHRLSCAAPGNAPSNWPECSACSGPKASLGNGTRWLVHSHIPKADQYGPSAASRSSNAHTPIICTAIAPPGGRDYSYPRVPQLTAFPGAMCTSACTVTRERLHGHA